jgi:hypothetical protein
VLRSVEVRLQYSALGRDAAGKRLSLCVELSGLADASVADVKRTRDHSRHPKRSTCLTARQPPGREARIGGILPPGMIFHEEALLPDLTAASHTLLGPCSTSKTNRALGHVTTTSFPVA